MVSAGKDIQGVPLQSILALRACEKHQHYDGGTGKFPLMTKA